MPVNKSKFDAVMEVAQRAQREGNSEEAYIFFSRAMELRPRDSSARLGKARAAGLSSFTSLKLDEMKKEVKDAIAFAPIEKKNETLRKGAEIVYGVSYDYYLYCHYHFKQFINCGWDNYYRFIDKCISALDGFDFAFNLFHHAEDKDLKLMELICVNAAQIIEKCFNPESFFDSAGALCAHFSLTSVKDIYEKLFRHKQIWDERKFLFSGEDKTLARLHDLMNLSFNEKITYVEKQYAVIRQPAEKQAFEEALFLLINEDEKKYYYDKMNALEKSFKTRKLFLLVVVIACLAALATAAGVFFSTVRMKIENKHTVSAQSAITSYVYQKRENDVK